MAYGTVNADVIGTSVAGSNLGAGDASLLKNRLINGSMVIDQRNAGASSTALTYTVDRWAYGATQASKGTWQQNAGSVTPPIGFTNYLGFTSSSAYSVLTGDTFAFKQTVEGYNVADLGWGTANAKTVTISFWVQSSLTGTFGGSITNGSLSYPFSYTISSANTWTQISITIVGPTTSTWATNNSGAFTVYFGLGSGSTFTGTAGSWQSGNLVQSTGSVSVVGTNGATFYITGVQLEVGSSATGFEYRQYGQELALCQRYYQVIQVGYIGYTATTNYYGSAYSFLVSTRATPTVTWLSTTFSPTAFPSTAGVNGNITTTGLIYQKLANGANVGGSAFGDSLAISAEL